MKHFKNQSESELFLRLFPGLFILFNWARTRVLSWLLVGKFKPGFINRTKFLKCTVSIKSKVRLQPIRKLEIAASKLVDESIGCEGFFVSTFLWRWMSPLMMSIAWFTSADSSSNPSPWDVQKTEVGSSLSPVSLSSNSILFWIIDWMSFTPRPVPPGFSPVRGSPWLHLFNWTLMFLQIGVTSYKPFVMCNHSSSWRVFLDSLTFTTLCTSVQTCEIIKWPGL